MEVDVEVLDLNDAEARALLLSIDPLAALAETQAQLHQRLIDLPPTDSADLRAAWEATVKAAMETPNDSPGHGVMHLATDIWGSISG